ncbi:MAG: 16S rRNA processing protein RimM [Alphaproteobacteria bacterium]|nr:16S rRNA processing protein RimM [Alphaproteobacteria bacterium]
MHSSPHLICVATIIAPHGIRGEVKIRTHTEYPETIEEYSPLLNGSGAPSYKVTIRQVIADDLVIARIEGITNRNEAETLRQVQLYITRDEMPDIDEDEFYHTDLIGLAVKNDQGVDQGVVVALHNFGAGDIIEIKFNNQHQSVMLPFTKATIPTIDLNHHFVIFNPPETYEIELGE